MTDIEVLRAFVKDHCGSPTTHGTPTYAVARQALDNLEAEVYRKKRGDLSLEQIIKFAEAWGWDGVNNSKVLEVFIHDFVVEILAENVALKESVSPGRQGSLAYYLGVARKMREKETVIKPMESPREMILEHRVESWVRTRLGASQMDRGERAFRLLEEAIELCQTEGVSSSICRQLVDYIYTRPAGTWREEAAGAAVCLFAYCATRGVKLNEIALEQTLQNESRTQELINQSMARKNDNGLLITNWEPK